MFGYCDSYGDAAHRLSSVSGEHSSIMGDVGASDELACRAGCDVPGVLMLSSDYAWWVADCSVGCCISDDCSLVHGYGDRNDLS